jgi:hypothetical protein
MSATPRVAYPFVEFERDGVSSFADSPLFREASGAAAGSQGPRVADHCPTLEKIDPGRARKSRVV